MSTQINEDKTVQFKIWLNYLCKCTTVVIFFFFYWGGIVALASALLPPAAAEMLLRLTKLAYWQIAVSGEK